MVSDHVGYFSDRATPDRTGHDLTAPELANLRWFSHGLRAYDVARVRCVSPETVKTQIASAKLKLAAKTLAHAVAIALRNGLIR